MATGYGSPVGGAVIGGFAPIVFTSPLLTGASVDSDIVVEWDLDNDGVFETPEEDVTAYVMAAETFTGRDWPSNLHGQASAGQLRVTLLNDDDRFSYFNADSPLNQDGRSLRTGRKIRIRTAESTPSDPVLLARDRFNRPDGFLYGSSDELGNVWSDASSTIGFKITNGQIQGTTQDGAAWVDQVNLGAISSGFAQLTLRSHVAAGNSIYLSMRRNIIGSTRLSCAVDHNQVTLYQVLNGVTTILGTYPLSPWPGMTWGLFADGTDCSAWVNGVEVITTTTTVPTTGTGVTVAYIWTDDQIAPPVADNFYVWDKPVQTTTGVIWTGDITEVNVSVTPGGTKIATVDATGVLARAASAQIAAPAVTGGAPTGVMVGETFTRADVMLPPGDAIDEGYVETGPVYLDDGDALSLARQFENTEFGFIFETPEGPPGFQSRTSRLTASSTGWWTDTPGQGVFEYSAIQPLDYQREVVNRVTAGVASNMPGGISLDRQSNTTSSGVQNHVDVVVPTVQKGDLLVVFIASTVGNSDVNWLKPFWWVEHRDAGSDIGAIRVYSQLTDGSESGSTVRFYEDSTNSGASWSAHVYRIRNWFGNYEGVQFAEPRRGTTPPSMIPSWGRFPTLFFTANGAFQSFGPSPSLGTAIPPAGYEDNDTRDSILGPSGGEVGLYTAYKLAIGGSETPSAFSGFNDFVLYDSVTFALRGFHGDFTDPLLNPLTPAVGGEGVFVTQDDADSQADHNAIVSYEAAGNMFDSVGDAEEYVEHVLDTYADDRPIIALTFPASKRAELREQAFTRRVGDKITVTANGSTGLGFERDFFIESISHRWANGGKTWDCTWELSPA